MQINSLHSKCTPKGGTPKLSGGSSSVAQASASEPLDQFTSCRSEEAHPSTSFKNLALDVLGAGMVIAAGATPGLGALVHFVGAHDTDRVAGKEKAHNLHSIGMIGNVLGTAAFLVNPLVGLAGLAVSGLATAGAFSESPN